MLTSDETPPRVLTNLKEDGVITNEVGVQTGIVNLMMAVMGERVSLTYIAKDSNGSGAWPIDTAT